jgi:hypothetical protein
MIQSGSTVVRSFDTDMTLARLTSRSLIEARDEL